MNLAVQIADERESSTRLFSTTIDEPERRVHEESSTTQFDRIGEVLSATEATFWGVGIPWLPPTKRIRKARIIDCETVEEALQYHLVGVSTVTLNSFIEELARPHDAAKVLERLSIVRPTRFERFCFMILVTTVVLLAALIVSITIGVSEVMGVGLASAVVVVLCIGRSLSNDSFRQRSFLAALRRELSRRQGVIDGASGNLRICPSVDG